MLREVCGAAASGLRVRFGPSPTGSGLVQPVGGPGPAAVGTAGFGSGLREAPRSLSLQSLRSSVPCTRL